MDIDAMLRFVVMCVATLSLAACGGGSSHHSSPPAPPTDFTIGGTISGLTTAPLVLSNYGEMLTLSVNGTFTFVSHQQSGSSFDVVVQRHRSVLHSIAR